MNAGHPDTVERWDYLEITQKVLKVPDRPFETVTVSAQFYGPGGQEKLVNGFYDGDGIWRIRFRPDLTGSWHFKTISSLAELDGTEGQFLCTPAKAANHGPVAVDRKTHFSYADGTQCFILGTTAYAWTYRPPEVRQKTLEAFSAHRFNKIRMLVFPKYLAWLKDIDLTYEPPCLPYPGTKGNYDYRSFIVAYFRNFEERIRDLRDRGIEADIILFHNYDFGKWGIDEGLSDDDAVFYLKYVAARLSAFRNVWWSLANEYDLHITSDGVDAVSKTDLRNWDRMGQTIHDADPYGHPVSIHNYGPIYPDRPWMSHVSYQFANTYSLLIDLKNKYGKPVINDEYQYEGNLPYGWGNLSGMEATIRHWLTLMAGGYGTHGECFVVDGNRRDIFWTYGGDMHGESASRLSFMRGIAESLPFQEMEPDHILADGRTKFCLRKDLDSYLYLFLPGSTNRRAKVGPQDGSKPEYEFTVFDAWACKETKRFVSSALYIANDDPGIVVVRVTRR